MKRSPYCSLLVPGLLAALAVAPNVVVEMTADDAAAPPPEPPSQPKPQSRPGETNRQFAERLRASTVSAVGIDASCVDEPSPPHNPVNGEET